MQSQQQLSFYCLFTIVLCLLQITCAQRGSYAGSRPTGLSQKDKYHLTTPRDIANRFGEADNSSTTPPNTIAFGAPQRPPVGYPIVQPQQEYVPLAVSQFALENRLGNEVNGGAASTGAAASAATGGNSNSSNNQAPPAALPFDALGDQQLIDHLYRVPEANRPFWLLNFQAIEQHRNGSGPKFSGAVASNQGSFFG